MIVFAVDVVMPLLYSTVPIVNVVVAAAVIDWSAELRILQHTRPVIDRKFASCVVNHDAGAMPPLEGLWIVSGSTYACTGISHTPL